MIRSILATMLISALTVACVRPADERFALDQMVGQESLVGLNMNVVGGQAAIRTIDLTGVVLWAQAPVVAIQVQSDEPRQFRVELLNCMPNALLLLGVQSLPPSSQPRPTQCIFEIDLPAGETTFRIAPPDWQDEEPFLFADMGDIQTAMGSVHEVFEVISREPDLRFVMSTGDVVEKGDYEEYELFHEKMESLDIPFFSTIGNHELTRDATRWHDLFGRFSAHFRFKGVDISYVDSGNATLDPSLHAQLDTWLDDGQDRVHIFGTHYPLFDPVGARNAGFRSRSEASKLLVKLARSGTDLTLYGHVHSLYQFENAGIPAYISGGGGALPERFDGINRHFLVVDVDPITNTVRSVSVRRVD